MQTVCFDMSCVLRSSAVRISNNDFPLGKIDQIYRDDNAEAFKHLTKLKAATQFEEQEASDYEIHVYDFNKNTGGGLAYLKLKDGTMATVRLAIKEYDAALHARTFTGSEHDGVFIQVHGRLTRSKNRPVKITVTDP